MIKPYCTLPFVQFSTTVAGNYQACCIAKKQSENIVDVSPMDFFNGEHMKQLRYDMLKPGEPTDNLLPIALSYPYVMPPVRLFQYP